MRKLPLEVSVIPKPSISYFTCAGLSPVSFTTRLVRHAFGRALLGEANSYQRPLYFYQSSSLALISTQGKGGRADTVSDGIAYPGCAHHMMKENRVPTMGQFHMAINGITLSSLPECLNLPEATIVLQVPMLTLSMTTLSYYKRSIWNRALCNWYNILSVQRQRQYYHSTPTLAGSRRHTWYTCNSILSLQAMYINEALLHKITRWTLEYFIHNSCNRLWHGSLKKSIYSQIKTITVADVCVSHPVHLLYRGSVAKLNNQPREPAAPQGPAYPGPG